MSTAYGSPHQTLAVGDTQRRCIATGATKDTSEMIRFVIGPDDRVVPDLARKLPGRGMWLTATRAAVELALAKRRFSYAVRRPVHVDADLADQLEALLVRRCADCLGLARRAGEMVAGFEKVRALLAGGTAGCLITASDAAADGRDKLRRLAGALPSVAVLSGAELSLAIGRENVVHAALTRGKLSDRFLFEVGRLAGLRSGLDHGTGLSRSNELEQV